MLADWINDLRRAGFDFTADEVADILWLAGHLDKITPAQIEKHEGQAHQKVNASASNDEARELARSAGMGAGSALVENLTQVVSQDLGAAAADL
jgi:hypothetical protein